MIERTYIGLAVLLVAAVAVVAWEMLVEREPVYDGKPVSYWISRSGEYYEGSDHGLIGSFPKADSNAIPFLITALQRRDRAWHAAYRKTWRKAPSWIRRRLPTPVIAEQVRFSTAMALGHMGPVAKPALPALLRVLQEDESAEVRGAAGYSLGHLGRGEGPVILALIEALSKHPGHAMIEAGLQSAVGTETWRQALLKCLSDQAGSIRIAATNALLRIDPEAAAKAGVKYAAIHLRGLPHHPGRRRAPPHSASFGALSAPTRTTRYLASPSPRPRSAMSEIRAFWEKFYAAIFVSWSTSAFRAANRAVIVVRPFSETT